MAIIFLLKITLDSGTFVYCLLLSRLFFIYSYFPVSCPLVLNGIFPITSIQTTFPFTIYENLFISFSKVLLASSVRCLRLKQNILILFIIEMSEEKKIHAFFCFFLIFSQSYSIIHRCFRWYETMLLSWRNIYRSNHYHSFETFNLQTILLTYSYATAKSERNS